MRRTKAEAAETRAAILIAAERIFFEKGVANSTLDDIAAAASVTRGAIYWHFQSKSDLFLELYNAVRLPQVNMMDLCDAQKEGADGLALIEKVACDWLDLLAVDTPRQRMLTILLRTNFTGEYEKVGAAIDALENEQAETLHAIFERARKGGTLAKAWSPETAAQSLRWLLKGLCWEWLLSGQKFDLVQEGRKAVRNLFASLRCP